MEAGRRRLLSPSPSPRGAERTRSSQSSSGSRATPSSPRSGCTPTRPSSWNKRWRASHPCRMRFAQSSIASGRAGSPGTSSRMSSSRRRRRKRGHPTWTASAIGAASAAERGLVQRALGKGLPEHDVYQAEPVVKLIDDLYRPLAEQLERSRFDSLLVTELLVLARAATSGSRVTTPSSMRAPSAPGTRPTSKDCWMRGGSARRTTSSREARSRGWPAAPLSHSCSNGSAPEIADDPQTVGRLHRGGRELGQDRRAAADAGRRRRRKRPSSPRPAELINDMLMAAPPPEMAAPSAPPPMAEANGGDAAESPTRTWDPRQRGGSC